ncbi:MAG: dethiobiotin synthase [Actinomycetes bacterium]
MLGVGGSSGCEVMATGQIVAVTGTDTGVGKTVVTAALACGAKSRGSVAVYKPVQTGTSIGDSDIDEVRRLSGVEIALTGSEQPEPLAPATAARRAGSSLPSLDAHVDAVRSLANSHDTVLVEGSGGVLVALTEDGLGIAELAVACEASTVIVARPGLGTLNHTALTAEALSARGCRIAGVIVGSWPSEPDVATLCNVDDLPTVTGLPLLGRLPEGASRLDPEEFGRRSPEWVSTAGWLP